MPTKKKRRNEKGDSSETSTRLQWIHLEPRSKDQYATLGKVQGTESVNPFHPYEILRTPFGGDRRCFIPHSNRAAHIKSSGDQKRTVCQKRALFDSDSSLTASHACTSDRRGNPPFLSLSLSFFPPRTLPGTSH